MHLLWFQTRWPMSRCSSGFRLAGQCLAVAATSVVHCEPSVVHFESYTNTHAATHIVMHTQNVSETAPVHLSSFQVSGVCVGPTGQPHGT
jgi:hypothetical protein